MRAFAKGTLNLVRKLGGMQGVYIRFSRHRKYRRRIRDRSQDRLASNDHELVLVGHVAAGADDVLKFFAGHCASVLSVSPSTTPFLSALTWSKMLWRTGPGSTMMSGEA